METLKTFTPAETHLILDSWRTEYKDLLKYTFLDLLCKKVLQLNTHEYDLEVTGKREQAEYISQGVNFDQYKPKPHEQAFLEPFKGNPDIEILLTLLVKMIREKIYTRKN